MKIEYYLNSLSMLRHFQLYPSKKMLNCIEFFTTNINNQYVSKDIYEKCLNNSLKKEDIMKIDYLPMNLQKIIYGNFDLIYSGGVAENPVTRKAIVNHCIDLLKEQYILEKQQELEEKYYNFENRKSEEIIIGNDRISSKDKIENHA